MGWRSSRVAEKQVCVTVGHGKCLADTIRPIRKTGLGKTRLSVSGSWLARPFRPPADPGDVCPAWRPPGWLTLPGSPFLLMWCRCCHLTSRETRLGPHMWFPIPVPSPSNPQKSLGVSELYLHTRPHMTLSSLVCGGPGNQNLKIRETRLYRQPWPSGAFLLISPSSLLCP